MRKKIKILQIYHPKHKMWLQSGGHIESQDKDPLDAVKREIKKDLEIPDLEQYLEHIPFTSNPLVPFDIHSHEVFPEGEKHHFHIDFRYVFIIKPNKLSEFKKNLNSNLGKEAHRWVSLEELKQQQPFVRLEKKLRQIFSRDYRPYIFFNRILKKLKGYEKPNLITIVHLIPDVYPYIQALSNFGNLITILAKPKSKKEEVLKNLENNGFKILEIDRNKIIKENIIQEIIKRNDGRFILIDIGGYFAPIGNQLRREFRNKFIGIIEDTENGLQRYEKLNNINFPLYSVARSCLKEFEDYLIGKSVVFSADAILRQINRVIEYLNCSIIGYGRIGKSIAENLINRGIKPFVYDINYIKRLEAFNRNCNIPPKEWILKNSDVIFCATGNKSLSMEKNDFLKLKPGAFIFSVTSADDEFDLENIEMWYEKEENKFPYVDLYAGNYNYFYLVFHGDAVNFLHNAVVGDFIHIVRAEIIYSAYKLLTTKNPPGIYELPLEDKEEIAKEWLSVFIDEPYGIYD